MRAALKAAGVLGGALSLAACAGGDRVTLLEPAQGAKRDAGRTGAVAVIRDEQAALDQDAYEQLSTDETDIAVLDASNEQARLRHGSARVNRLDKADPDHAELMRYLPLEVMERSFTFQTQSSELSAEELGRLRDFLRDYVERFNARYSEFEGLPELHVEITGYADSAGYEGMDDDAAITARNVDLSKRRATAVYYQLLAVLGDNIPIRGENIEIVGAGDYAALEKWEGERRSDESFRIVNVTVR